MKQSRCLSDSLNQFNLHYPSLEEIVNELHNKMSAALAQVVTGKEDHEVRGIGPPSIPEKILALH